MTIEEIENESEEHSATGCDLITFNPGDRVKVVRESESMPEFREHLMPYVGKIGVVVSHINILPTHLVIFGDGIDRDSQFIPADMLELEVGE